MPVSEGLFRTGRVCITTALFARVLPVPPVHYVGLFKTICARRRAPCAKAPGPWVVVGGRWSLGRVPIATMLPIGRASRFRAVL